MGAATVASYTASSDEEDSRAESLVVDGWDVITWSESATPAIERHVASDKRDDEMSRNTDTTSSASGLARGSSGSSSEELGLPSRDTPSDFSYLDFLDSVPDVFTGEFDFDFGLDAGSASSQDALELGDSGLLQETFEALEPLPSSTNVHQSPAGPSHVLSSLGHDVLFVDPAALLLREDPSAPAEPPAPGISSSETFEIVSRPPVSSSRVDPTRLSSSSSSNDASRRRRQRSPSPIDHQQRMAAALFCFQMDLPGQASHRPNKRMRGQKSEQRRKEIADVREKRACIRCHMQKLTCDGGTPCMNCLRVRGKERLSKAICERLNLKEAIGFRIGNSKFNQETATVRQYPSWAASAVTRTMILQRPAEASSLWPKGASRPYLEILVKEFRPGPQDITAERWRSGQNEVILELPAYSAFDNEATTAALLGWVDDNFDLYAKDMKAQPGDFLIGATFDEALRYASANPDSIVKLALKIWIGVRMAQEFFCVREDNDFDISIVDDLNSVHHGMCPVPPVLDHQVDVLMIQEMIRMQNQILKTIEEIMQSRNDRGRWYEIYLTIFVLLANLQYIYRSQERWWRMHFNTGKGNAIGKAYQSISYRFMERYVFSAKNLLAHFQYGVKGTIPFTLDWDKESTKKLGDLDKDAVKYVKYVSGIARRRRDEFVTTIERAKLGEYEGDMFWLAQMFVDLRLDDSAVERG